LLSRHCRACFARDDEDNDHEPSSGNERPTQTAAPPRRVLFYVTFRHAAAVGAFDPARALLPRYDGRLRLGLLRDLDPKHGGPVL